MWKIVSLSVLSLFGLALLIVGILDVRGVIFVGEETVHKEWGMIVIGAAVFLLATVFAALEIRRCKKN
jgi:glucose uptake protein GlcU